MGLLDQPLIAEDIRVIREKKKIKHKMRNLFKRNVPKKLRKEWGERMAHLRSIK